MGAERRGDIAALGVGREIEDVAVAAGADHDDVGGPGFDGSRDEVAGDDALGLAVDEDEIEHLMAGVHLHRAEADLAGERGVGADEELLAGLTAGVESTRDLGAAEGTVGEEASVFTGERHALRDALVDDVRRDLGEAVDVGFAGAVVAALDGVLEKAAHAVAVVLVVLRGIDATLRGNRVGAARAVLIAEAGDFVAHLGERGGGGGAGEARADHDDVVFPAVGWAHQAELRLMVIPLVGQRAGGSLRVEIHGGACFFHGSLLQVTGEHGERDGDEAECDDPTIGQGETVETGTPALVAQAEGLEDAAHPVTEVQAEQQ